MAKEIEHKFLVKSDNYRLMANAAHRIAQGYISRRPEGTVRVRILDDRAFLTVKGKNDGLVRDEWEYEIPLADAAEMLDRTCEGKSLEKTRYIVDYEGFIWEVDEFHGAREGLVVAEVEVPSADTVFPLPPFVGEEVTGDPAYYNSNL